jgi:hypothetical protein
MGWNLASGKVIFFSEIFSSPLGDGDRNCANLDYDKQK